MTSRLVMGAVSVPLLYAMKGPSRAHAASAVNTEILTPQNTDLKIKNMHDAICKPQSLDLQPPPLAPLTGLAPRISAQSSGGAETDLKITKMSEAICKPKSIDLQTPPLTRSGDLDPRTSAQSHSEAETKTLQVAQKHLETNTPAKGTPKDGISDIAAGLAKQGAIKLSVLMGAAVGQEVGKYTGCVTCSLGMSYFFKSQEECIKGHSTLGAAVGGYTAELIVERVWDSKDKK